MRLFKFHLGREMPVYALWGTLAAKVNLKSVFAERPELVSGFTDTQGFSPCH